MNSTQTYWRRKARIVAFRWNLAVWLHFFLRFAVIVSFVMMCALLVVRRNEGPIEIAWLFFETTLGLGAVAGIISAHRQFCSLRQALVRLDFRLGLHNQLTAAMDGVGEWPPEITKTPDGLRWRWERLIVPPAACAAALLFASHVKIQPDGAADHHRKEEPLSWTRVESELETLKKQDVVNEESINNLMEQVDELRKQSPENWYSHSSMEAGDNLQNKTEDAIRALKRDLETVSNILNNFAQNPEMMSDDQAQKLNGQFQQALQGLQMGTLPLNKELMSKLQNLDANQLKNLSPQQLANLQQSLQKGITGAQSSLNPGDEEHARLVGLIQGQGQNANGTIGAGGRGGGGGPAQLGLKQDKTDLKTKTSEQVSNDDLSHAAAGDLVGVNKGEHKIDQTKYSGPVNAGSIQSPGAGGETVWKNQVTPQEREILERFYK